MMRKVTYIDNTDKGTIMFGEIHVGAAASKNVTQRTQSPVNDIIVKIEMKKFQNLINNRKNRKNNLVN